MLFTSYQFMFFLPIAALIYYLIPQKLKSVWLLGISFFFYMCWNAQYAILLAITIVTTYLPALFLNKTENISSSQKNFRRLLLSLSITINLGLLFFYKYLDFALSNIWNIFSWLNLSPEKPVLNLVLPVGISFYTFKALSYILDVYKGKYGCVRNFIHYATYVSFFPALLSGPIDRANDFIPQLERPHKFNYVQVRRGILLMLWGYFLKVVISDRAAQFASVVYGNHSEYSGAFIMIATFLYAIQIYCDFYGYSATAKGVAQVLDFHIIENFRQPYFATTISEFWRRWHISLSSWLRDYVYIGLGGNRCSKLRKYFNLMATFLVSGLWHGASWNYIIWGFIHGFYQIFGDLTKNLRKRLLNTLHIDSSTCVHRCFSRLINFLLVSFAWIFFYANGTKVALNIIRHMFTEFKIWTLFDGSLFDVALSRPEFSILILSLFVLLVIDILKYNHVNIQGWIESQHVLFRWLLYYVAVFSIILFGIYGNEYSASAFVYFQF